MSPAEQFDITESEAPDLFETETLDPEWMENLESDTLELETSDSLEYDYNAEYNEFDGEVGDANYGFPEADVGGRLQEVMTVLDEIDGMFNELGMDTEIEFEEAFLGKLVRRAARVVSSPIKTVVRAGGQAIRTVRNQVGTVTRQLAKITPSPLRKVANYYAKLASLAAGPGLHFAYRFGKGVISGENVLKAAKMGVKAGAQNLREGLQLASMAAPFIPGVGSGVAAALGAANALASGKPITEAVLAGVRNALPGGAIAQTAFDMGVRLARGENLSKAALNTALNAARERIPGGAAGKAAFDAAVALGRGQKLQQVMATTAGRALAPSRFAAAPGQFVQGVLSGRNIQQAALSQAGQHVFRNLNRQGISLIRAVNGRPYQRRSGASRGYVPSWRPAF
ncbi:MAG: hypothetical protein U1F76_00420 [Candidatus Competibacteraceae bacterium]